MKPRAKPMRAFSTLASGVLLLAACAGGEVAGPLRVDALHPASESRRTSRWARTASST
jgi:hypothetical protein